jgi:hypothetical protein
MEVLGVEATVRLRQFELALDRVFGFADSHPNVITTALSNAHKFVPERVTTVGSGAHGESLMGAAAILGDFLGQGAQNAAGPTAPIRSDTSSGAPQR